MKLKALTTAMCLTAVLFSGAASAGPLVLMGIDAEDGGVGGHGPLSVYTGVSSSILGATTNGGNGILVFGGGSDGSQVRSFWLALGAAVGEAVTFVTSAASITGQSLAGFQMVGVASDVINTPSGGLTALENTALAAKQAAIASFVNGGGGLLGFSQAALGASAYSYLGALGSFTFASSAYSDITPTAAGTTIGITNALDVNAWHDTFSTFPSFLNVLATAPNGQAAAIGGISVTITPVPEPSSVLLVASALIGCAALRRRKPIQ